MSRNGFIYVQNNPLKYVDPSGKFIDVFLDAFFVAIDVGQTVWGGGQYIYGKVTDNQDLVNKVGKTAKRLEGISQSGKKAINVNGNVRYPDKMTLDSIVEVKGGTKIGNRDAGQIQDFVDYAKQTDKQVYVSGRKGMNTSKIQDLIDNGSVVKKDLGSSENMCYSDNK